MNSVRRMVQMGFTEDLFPEGTHMCYIFNDDGERNRLIPKFLQSGLAGNEKVGCFVDQISQDELKNALVDLGVDVSALEQAGRLSVLEAKQVYCPGDRFTPESMLGTLTEFHQRALADGLLGSRVTGEMTWALNGCAGSDRLIEYEMGINNLVIRHPITAICQYDARRFDGATLLEVLQVHPMMVVKGQVVRNPYYRSSAGSGYAETV